MSQSEYWYWAIIGCGIALFLHILWLRKLILQVNEARFHRDCMRDCVEIYRDSLHSNKVADERDYWKQTALDALARGDRLELECERLNHPVDGGSA